MNKKGTFKVTKEAILWLTVRFIIVFVVVFFILALFESYFSSNVKVDNIQQYVLRERLLLSGDCLAYENYRTYPGIIDINKFNEIRLSDCLRYETPKSGVGIKLNLAYENNKIDVYVNEDLGNKMDFCVDKKNFVCSNTDYYVLVYDNGLKKGNLNIQTIKLK